MRLGLGFLTHYPLPDYVALAGVGVVIAAVGVWAGLPRRIVWYRHPPVLVTLSVLSIAVTAAWVVHSLVVSPRGFVDLSVYRLGVAAWWQHGDLYGDLPPTGVGLALPFTYPPFAVLALGPLAVPPWRWSIGGLTALSVSALLVVIYFTIRVAWPAGGRRGALVGTAVMLPLSLFVEPVADTIWFGQVNLLLMALVVVDCLALPSVLWLVARSRPARPDGSSSGLLVHFLAGDRRSRSAVGADCLAQSEIRAHIDGSSEMGLLVSTLGCDSPAGPVPARTGILSGTDSIAPERHATGSLVGESASCACGRHPAISSSAGGSEGCACGTQRPISLRAGTSGGCACATQLAASSPAGGSEGCACGTQPPISSPAGGSGGCACGRQSPISLSANPVGVDHPASTKIRADRLAQNKIGSFHGGAPRFQSSRFWVGVGRLGGRLWMVGLLWMGRWRARGDRGMRPRGVLIGLAVAVKLTPAVFLLFFLLRKDYRAAVTMTVTAVLATLVGFLADWSGSVTFWFGSSGGAHAVGDTDALVNQSLAGGLARAGHPGTALWLVLVAVLLVFAIVGVRKALRDEMVPLAVIITAGFGLVASPISWGHHWIYVVPAVIVLAVNGITRRRAGWLVAAVALVAVFRVAPFLDPDVGNEWAPVRLLAENSYVVTGVALLLIYAGPDVCRLLSHPTLRSWRSTVSQPAATLPPPPPCPAADVPRCPR
jgi:hypothetical protein